MKHCTVIPIKDQKAIYVGGVKSSVCGFYTTLQSIKDQKAIYGGGVEGAKYCTINKRSKGMSESSKV